MSTLLLPPWPTHWEWRHPDPMTRRFELVHGDTVHGSVRFTNLLGTRAAMEACGAAWTLERTGLLRQNVEGRVAGAAEDAAPDFTTALEFAGGAVLERADNPPLRWMISASGSGDVWGWTSGTELLVRFEPAPSDSGLLSSLLQLQGRATVAPPAISRPDVPLLLALGWYLTAAKQFDLLANPPSV